MARVIWLHNHDNIDTCSILLQYTYRCDEFAVELRHIIVTFAGTDGTWVELSYQYIVSNPVTWYMNRRGWGINGLPGLSGKNVLLSEQSHRNAQVHVNIGSHNDL